MPAYRVVRAESKDRRLLMATAYDSSDMVACSVTRGLGSIDALIELETRHIEAVSPYQACCEILEPKTKETTNVVPA